MKRPFSRPRRRWFHPNTVVLLRQCAVGFSVLAFLALLGIGVWHGTRLPSLTLAVVTVAGGETVPHELVRERVEAVLAGEYARFIPKRFAWLYPEVAIYDAIKTLPRVNDVSVERISGTELAVAFDEHLPSALWCESPENSACLFLDKRGYAFAAAPRLSGGIFIRYHSAARPLELGTEPFAAEDFASTQTLTALLAAEGFFVRSVEIDAARDAYFSLWGGGELRASLLQAPDRTFENFGLVRGTQEFSDLRPGTFRYIDLRFGNKVYINEELEKPESATAATSANVVELAGGE
jgi:hypothetical protein